LAIKALHRTAAPHVNGEFGRLGGAAVGELCVRPHRIMKLTRFTFCILSAVLVLVSGCTFLLHPINSTFARHSNPIADWTFRALDEYAPPRDQHHFRLSKAITDDYQQFIAEKKFP